MGFLDELIASAKSVVGKAEQQTDKMVELSKLKYQSAQLAGELKSLYEKLGRAVYEMMNSEYENKELVDSLAEEITEVKAALAVVDDKINQRMNRQICAACGAQNSKEAVFCMKCGAKLETEEAPVPCGCGCDGETENCGCEGEEPCCESEKPCCEENCQNTCGADGEKETEKTED